FVYSNAFECVPASVPFRPLRLTPKPNVQGCQTAVVVGPSGEEIFTDKYGRVKVQFFWDREGKKNEDSSCWMRVSYPWAGKGWGVCIRGEVRGGVAFTFRGSGRKSLWISSRATRISR